MCLEPDFTLNPYYFIENYREDQDEDNKKIVNEIEEVSHFKTPNKLLFSQTLNEYGDILKDLNQDLVTNGTEKAKISDVKFYLGKIRMTGNNSFNELKNSTKDSIEKLFDENYDFEFEYKNNEIIKFKV